ncbi:MAG TPA: hypothetical protein VE109_04085, partial [Acidobacteriaceae bacterium]|nr:hypothetical protein [Acidobacteriaceae bacterium]
ELKKLTIRYPHPLGEIVANYEVASGNLHADITLPAGLSGTFELHGKSHPLRGGKTELDLQ